MHLFFVCEGRESTSRAKGKSLKKTSMGSRWFLRIKTGLNNKGCFQLSLNHRKANSLSTIMMKKLSGKTRTWFKNWYYNVAQIKILSFCQFGITSFINLKYIFLFVLLGFFRTCFLRFLKSSIMLVIFYMTVIVYPLRHWVSLKEWLSNPYSSILG